MTDERRRDGLKAEFERLGERAGHRLGRRFRTDRSGQAGQLGRRLGGAIGGQLGRLDSALEKETLSSGEELGVGGKVGAGIGGLGKEILKTGGNAWGFGPSDGSVDMASEGRKMGAKMEKMLKKKTKSGIEHLRHRVLGKKKG